MTKRIMLGVILLISLLVVLSGCGKKDKNDLNQGGNENLGEETTIELQRQIMNMFNAKLEKYSGPQRAQNVVELMEEISSINSAESKHIVEVYLENEKMTLEDMKEYIESGNKYTVELGYDREGYINKITIRE